MSKFDLVLSSPLMNAAGILGFAPDPHGAIDLAHFGAFITNPISLETRTTAGGCRYEAYSGGFLFHTGYPNPGFHTTIKSFAARWSRSALGVIVHLLVHGPEDTAQMAERLEAIDGLMGIELGLASNVDIKTVRSLTEAAAWAELPVITRLPLERADELAAAAMSGGAVAVSLAPPRGSLPNAYAGMRNGRLYGPAVFPQAMAATQSIAAQGIPVIAAGGIYTEENAQALLSAGALGVQLDAVLWRASFVSK